MSSVAAPLGAPTALTDLDAINDEERLRILWQQAEDFGERRRIRARMYKLREQRLREMVQNDEESLGTLNVTEDGGLTECSETTITVGQEGESTRRSSNIQVTMHVDGDSAVTESISTQNVRLGGLTMRGMDNVSIEGLQPEDAIQERIRKASEDRSNRLQRIIGELTEDDVTTEGDAVVSITKSTYSIQSNALAGEGYISMKNKEVRDSVSPTRIIRERRSSAEDETHATDGRLTSDDETALKTEGEDVTQSLSSSAYRTSSSRKSSRDERSTTATSRTTRSRQSEIPVRKESPRKVTERKTSKELDLGSVKRVGSDKASPTSPSKRVPGESSPRSHMPRRTGAQKEAPTSPLRSPTRADGKSVTTSKKSKLAEIEAKMETSIMSELDKLDSYLSASVNDDDEVIMEEEEDCVDDSGNVVKVLVQTRRKKDGTEYTARRVARSTKVVSSESEIDEILVGNPDHEVLERDVAEEEDKDGNKIKIITETRRRPDGIIYTTKNVLKTSKIFDYDHPEDIAYNEEDELISTDETEETDENGITIQTVTETRRKPNGVEYTTKKVYKTSKVKSTQITPSDDDEVIDTQEMEEKKEDGSVIRTVIETRRTKTGEEYTHRQVFRSRKMTLSGVDLQKGLPTFQNDDDVISKEEKEETDDNGVTVKVVTETRRRKDGSTYSFEYVLRSFQGTEDDMKKMPVGSSGSSNIAVSADDELLKEEIKEDVQEDGTTVRTIIERRRAKDGTEYLRHRIMRIPKMPEPVLQVANLEDEVLQEEVNEETLNDGTHYKTVTERRRSSVSGLQYTLRRMSKIYQQPTHHPKSSEDEILDESVTEEETDDGTTIKTIIQRYQRSDGSVYTTHNIHKMFSSPAPVTFVGNEKDELVDQSVDEQETEDGYVVKTVTETRKRSDGVQYTVERTEKTSKHGPQVHIAFSTERSRKPEDLVHTGSPDDTVVSSEEQEHEEEDGTVVRIVTETVRRVDGTEYTTKTVLRSSPVLVPERETSYVIIKPEKGGEEDDEEAGFFPSQDDEVVYTRKKEEVGEDGQPITIIIETRRSKTTGERYNITKRVHTKEVVMTEEGEREVPRPVMKSTLVANIAPSPTHAPDNRRPDTTQDGPDDEQDDVPYGSVSALKSRFVPGGIRKPDTSEKTSRPDRLNTLNKKKFFEDAAKSVTPTSTKSSPKKTEPRDRSREPEREPKRDLLPEFTDDKASIQVKLRVEKDEASVEDVATHRVTYQPDEAPEDRPDSIREPKDVDIKDLDTEIAKLEEEEEERYEHKPEPESVEEPEEEEEEEEMPDDFKPDEDLSSPSEEEPQEPLRRRPEVSGKTPTTPKRDDKPRKKPEGEPRKRREVSPKKKPEADEPSRRVPATSRKQPSQDDSPTRRVPGYREPITPKDSTRRAPQRGKPNGPEPVSPTRTQRTTPRSTVPSKKTISPEGKPRMNGDVRRTPTEPRMNGDISRKPDDRTPRTRRTVEKPSEPERPASRSSRLSQTPRKAPTARSPEKREPVRSPDKREPTKPVSSRATDRKSPTKPNEKTPRGRQPGSEPKEKPKSSLSVPHPTDPVVTLPETPMTEDMKPLPVDDDVMIEDVSCEPDLPYHTIHRPSIVREPSEYQSPADSQEDAASDSSPEEHPKHPDEPSDTEPHDTEPQKKTGKKPLEDELSPEEDESSPLKEDVSKPRRSKPLESRPADKGVTPKDSEPSRRKQSETKRATRDRPWLIEKRNSFERKPSEPKLSSVRPDDGTKTPERRKPYERKPSEETIRKPSEDTTEKPSEDTGKKPKEERPFEDHPDEEDYPSNENEGKENGIPEEIPRDTPTSHEEVPEEDEPVRKKPEEIPAKLIEDVEKSIITKTVTEKNITTSDVATRRSVFNLRTSQPDNKRDKPTRKPSYEIKESVSSKRSLFEQPKQDHVPSPIRRPVLKSTPKKDEKPKKPEERKPVKEPRIVPKYFHPLGDGDGDEPVEKSAPEPVEKSAPEPVEEDIKMTSSKLVMNAMAATHTTVTRREPKKPEPSDAGEEPALTDEEEPDTVLPLKKERSPSPMTKEGSPVPRSKEASPAPRSKEGSPAPFSKEGSPTRFVTGKPVDSGINTNKIRRIERTGSNKKLLEDLEVSRENLPQYLLSIETIYDVTLLENMLEKAETYEERRIIRGQMRLAKRPGSRTTTPVASSPAKAPSRPSSQPKRPTEPKATTRPEDSEEPRFRGTTRKPLSRSEEPRTRPATDEPDEDEVTPADEVTPTTKPSRKPSRDSYKEPDREPSAEPVEPEEPEKRKQPEEPRRFDRQVKPEEPRRYGRLSKPEEPKKTEPISRTPDVRKPERTQPQPTKTAPSNEPFAEPLRYQKGQSRTPSKPATEQTDVDKIVSAYGVGPTDENGVPLFGLRALKRRSPPTTCESTPREDQPDTTGTIEESKPLEDSHPSTRPEEPKEEEFEPKDSSGRPLFGLRALRKSATDTTSVTTTESTQERVKSSVLATRETASVVESSRLVSNITKRPTHTTEVISTESPRDSESPEPVDPQEAESEEEAESIEHYSSEEETSPGLVRTLRDSMKKKKDTTEELEPTTRRPSGQSPDPSSRTPEDEVITRRSQPLKEILKLHESKVQEPVAEGSPRLKPKQRLRENFEALSEKQDSRVHKTWDLETDLSTRSLDMKNIIAHHETITTEETPKPEKKLTGILKKTSSSNILTTDIRSTVTSEKTIDSESKEEVPVKEHVNDPDDILDTLTEDQITKLSEEFDLRAQEDGVINTEESIEELSGGYRVTSRTEGDHPDGAKFVRKTSYTEIKLQQPKLEEGSRVVTSSSSATVEHSAGSSTFHVTREAGGSGQDITQQAVDTDDAMREGRSFLEDRSKVTGFNDVLSRMGATEAVDHEAKVTSDDQARSLLNRFLGAQVLMSGVESMMSSSSLSESSRMVCGEDGQATVTDSASGHKASRMAKDGVVTDDQHSSFSTGPVTTTVTTTPTAAAALKVQADSVVISGVNISEVTDDIRLNQLLDSCDEYEDRRRIRMRLKSLMAEKKALREELSGHDLGQGSHTQASSAQSKFEAMSKSTTSSSKESNLRSSEDVALVNDWLMENFPEHRGPGGGRPGDSKTSSTVSPFGVSRTSTSESRNSSQVNVQKSSYSSSFSSSTSSNKTSYASKTDSKKVVSPFDKFKQMDAQTSRSTSSKSKSAGGGPLFQLSSQLSRSASGVKDMLLTWCQCRTRDYKGIKIENFSTSWNDGMAFCALIHHFYPDAFDFDKLEPKNRRYNFELAFRVADEKAGIMPLLDVDDMVMMKKPDWKCVFTYVQSLYKRLKDE